jgi:hypothetical protein
LAIRVSCQNSQPRHRATEDFLRRQYPPGLGSFSPIVLHPFFIRGVASQETAVLSHHQEDHLQRWTVYPGASLTTSVGDEPIPSPPLPHRFIIDDDAIILHSIVTYISHP